MTSQKRRVSVAVVGLGDMGVKHARIYQGMPGVEVTAVVDANPAALAQRAEELGLPASSAFASVEAALAAYDRQELSLDAVDVCVPNSLHAPVSIQALGRGLDVMCEKPMADTLEAARQLAAAATLSRGDVMFGFLYRHHPEVVAWIERAAGGLGQLLLGHVSLMRRDGIPDRPAFRNRALTGGGPGVDLLPHALAVVGDVLGDDAAPTWVVGGTFGAAADEVEHLAAGTFLFKRSSVRVAATAQLTVETSWRANLPEGAPDECWTIKLIGTEGGFEIDLPIGPGAAQPGYEAELATFVERVRGITPWPDEVRQALRVQEMVAKLYESASYGGDPVRIGPRASVIA